jgi:hypothetical protein
MNMKNLEEFRSELTTLINRFNIDSVMETPDYMLADHLVLTMMNLEATIKARTHWFPND